MGDAAGPLQRQNPAKLITEVGNMQSSEKLSVPVEGNFYFCVQPMIQGTFGVYANTVLIAIHTERAIAEVHCQRLRDQQFSEQ